MSTLLRIALTTFLVVQIFAMEPEMNSQPVEDSLKIDITFPGECCYFDFKFAMEKILEERK